MVKKAKKSAKSVSKIVSPKYIELKGFLSFFILHELNGKMLSGDELAEIVGARKGVTLTPGTIYPALKRLRRLGLIRFKRDGRKKVYYLNKEGSLELRALYNMFGELFLGLKGRLKR
jgi:DNA-binding PadR family transcriptional regulator